MKGKDEVSWKKPQNFSQISFVWQILTGQLLSGPVQDAKALTIHLSPQEPYYSWRERTSHNYKSPCRVGQGSAEAALQFNVLCPTCFYTTSLNRRWALIKPWKPNSFSGSASRGPIQQAESMASPWQNCTHCQLNPWGGNALKPRLPIDVSKIFGWLWQLSTPGMTIIGLRNHNRR